MGIAASDPIPWVTNSLSKKHTNALIRSYLLSSFWLHYIHLSLWRLLSTQIWEHFSVWFYKGERKTIRNSILEHLIESNHSTDQQIDFKVFYTTCPNLTNFLCSKLKTAEDFAFNELELELRVKMKYVLSILLYLS